MGRFKSADMFSVIYPLESSEFYNIQAKKARIN